MNKPMKIIRAVWNKWLRFGRFIVNIQTQVVFTAFYFLVLWIIGFAVRIFSDPLGTKQKKISSSFTLWNHPIQTLKHAHDQY